MLSIRGLRLNFPALEPWVTQSSSPPHRWSHFICVRVWGLEVLPAALPAPLSATLSRALLVYLRECGAAGSASGQTACPVRPSLLQSRSATATRVLSAPVSVSAPPTGLDVCFFFIYLVSDFLAVRFSVSSGCARRRSVSTYAATLVLLFYLFSKRSRTTNSTATTLVQVTLAHLSPSLHSLYLLHGLYCSSLLASLSAFTLASFSF